VEELLNYHFGRSQSSQNFGKFIVNDKEELK